ncbi:MAG: hypothetical protein AAF479_16465 [Pseudomonadota bacterium]
MANTTTKTSTKAAKENAAEAATEAAAAAVTEAQETTKSLTDGARDYVSRTACAAKERTDSAYERVGEFNKGVESTLTRAIQGYVSVLDGIARVNHENVNRALATVEKTAAATSYVEAAQIQVDFVRDAASANYETAREAIEQVRETVTDGVQSLTERASEIWSSTQKAA